VFGGYFDPFHKGHLGSIETVLQNLKLDKLLVIPTAEGPLRQSVQGSPATHRLEMVRLGLKGADSRITVDDREIRRGGVSYTIDTLNEIKAENPKAELFLVVGVDQLMNFHRWREYSDILEIVDLVVTSRPGQELPKSRGEFPSELRGRVKTVTKGKAQLDSGKYIHLVPLVDVEISGTELRRLIRSKQDVSELVSNEVAEYVEAHQLYEEVKRAIGDFEKFTEKCAQWLAGKGGLNVKGFDLRAMNGPTEFTLIASGTSTRHASGLAESLSREVKTQMGVWPQGTEGLSEGRWVVLDYGSLIVHVFYDYVRQEYRLEDLWSRGKPLKLVGVNPENAPERASHEKTWSRTT
jgi:nicotinate-nucleotide adenylyltransferase